MRTAVSKGRSGAGYCEELGFVEVEEESFVNVEVLVDLVETVLNDVLLVNDDSTEDDVESFVLVDEDLALGSVAENKLMIEEKLCVEVANKVGDETVKITGDLLPSPCDDEDGIDEIADETTVLVLACDEDDDVAAALRIDELGNTGNAPLDDEEDELDTPQVPKAGWQPVPQ